MEGGSGWRPYGRQADGTILPGETCTVPSAEDECEVGPGVVDMSVDTGSIAYGIECISAFGCVNGSTIYAARATVHSAVVTITDEVAPSVTDPSGPLVNTSRYHRGTEAVRFTGEDTTGIKALRVYVDGALTASLDSGGTGWEACSYTRVVPCGAPLGDRSINVDTTQLTDGTHHVQVAAVDAAGNETRAATRTIMVDNTAPGTPQALATSVGQDWQTSRALTATWTNPASQLAPLSIVHWSLCPLAAPNACFDGDAPATPQAVDLQLPGEGEWELSLTLEDQAGNVTADAATTAVRYDATPPGAPRQLTIAPRAATDPQIVASWAQDLSSGSPIVAAHWTLCRADDASACTSGTAAPTGPLALQLPAPGEWSLRVALHDQAGNTGAVTTATLAYKLPQTSPPVVTPPAEPTVPRASTALTVTKATLDRSRRRVTVHGRIHPNITGRLRVTVRYRTGTKLHRRTFPIRVRAGRFAGSIRLREAHAARARQVRVSARFAGSTRHRPATSRRNATIRR
jgi:hypothetical protein